MAKKLILVCGLLAAGKTTFARALSARLAVPCYTKDDLNEVIGECIVIPDVAARQKLSIASVRTLLYIADQALAVGQPVILESNFKPMETEAVRALAERHQCPTLTFALGGQVETLFARYIARENSAERHPIHKYHGTPDLAAFSQAIQALAGFAPPGRRIAVDTTDFAAVDWQALYTAAETFLHELDDVSKKL